ncbi:MAG: DUF1566 domain-containing protein [Gammaproteobacteria bacterium]|nr:DUF1566 domain-containing protein [Gammaproteobacteria bacterium]
MTDIFINYRRRDSRADAGRLYDRLSKRFGHRHVFRDIGDIGPGQNFSHVLNATLDQCTVMIVLIGRGWLDADNMPRLHDPADFVRQEIEKALAREILIIPVLVGDAKMPASEDLPEVLEGLAQRQALEISDARFDEDVDLLISTIASTIGGGSLRRNSIRWVWIAGLVLLLIMSYISLEPIKEIFTLPLDLRSEGATVSANEAKIMLVRRGFFHADLNLAGEGLASDYKERVINGQGVIVDPTTALMWQKTGRQLPMPFERAQAHVRESNAMRLAGFDDWRLPTLEEAMSLMQPQKHAEMYISPAFGRTAPFVFTSDLASPERRWIVYFWDGLYASEPLAFSAYLRAVRNAD